MAPLEGLIKPKTLSYICQLQIDGTVTSGCKLIKRIQRWLHPTAVFATYRRGLHQQSKSLLLSTIDIDLQSIVEMESSILFLSLSLTPEL